MQGPRVFADRHFSNQRSRHDRSATLRRRVAHHGMRDVARSSNLLPVHTNPWRAVSRCFHNVTQDAKDASDLLSVHSHRRRGLTRAVRGQGIHIATLDAGKSNVASHMRAHQSRSPAIAVRRQHVPILTPCVMECGRYRLRN